MASKKEPGSLYEIKIALMDLEPAIWRRLLRKDMGNRKTAVALTAGSHFDRDVIILCVRRYLRYKLSLRDLVEMMAERGLSLAHTTILRRSSSNAGPVRHAHGTDVATRPI